MPLEIAFSPILVLASIAIAITASFTALRMTSNLRLMTIGQKKKRVAQGALALGGGIWSMHFVGMLAVDMPLTIAYDPLPTLGSALIAVLVTGCALLCLHFGIRNKKRIAIAGVITGIGIVTMHYLGMSAISANCIVSYDPIGLIVATAIAIAASIAAMELAYGQRTLISTIAGSVLLGIAISAMHYAAIYFTLFSINAEVTATPIPLLSKDNLALVVALSSFVICGLFLLSALPSALGATPDNEESEEAGGAITANNIEAATVAPKAAVSATLSRAMSQPPTQNAAEPSDDRIPYDRNKTIRFLSPASIFMAQADGHYTKLHDGKEELFCPWPISRLEKKLNPAMFIRTHRSYIVNHKMISGLRRDGDKAFCVVGEAANLEAPVSRGRMAELRALLQID